MLKMKMMNGKKKKTKKGWIVEGWSKNNGNLFWDFLIFFFVLKYVRQNFFQKFVRQWKSLFIDGNSNEGIRLQHPGI